MAKDPNLEVNNNLTIPADELAWRYSTSGGPGGQHANKAHTRAEVTFEIAESVVLSDGQRSKLLEVFGPRVRVIVDESRSQMRNRQVASERLAKKLAEALTPKRVRRASKPGRGAKERRLKAKRQNSQRKANRQVSYDD